MHRRFFLQSAAAMAASRMLSADAPAVLEPWTPGTLDIYHLAYGRGNSTFVLCPDGTTLLIDAGTDDDSTDVSCAQKPSTAVRPGQWIAAYIQRQMQAASRRELDYFLLTHLHPDHSGALGDVDAAIPIGKVIDRGFPTYTYPTPQTAPFGLTYLNYIQSRRAKGRSCEQVRVGSAGQLRLLRQPDRFADFSIRAVAANGEVWTGLGDATRQTFPDLKTLKTEDYPTENMCSIALRLNYGRFRYFTGGDLTSDTEETGQGWRDIETAAARASGPVDVAVANHHGYFDAVGPGFVRELRPRVFVVPAWYVAHPDIHPLRRMLSRRLYPGPRDVYATCTMDATRAFNTQYSGKLKSLNGHVVVRVSPGGGFRVMVVDNSDDAGRVVSSVVYE